MPGYSPHLRNSSVLLSFLVTALLLFDHGFRHARHNDSHPLPTQLSSSFLVDNGTSKLNGTIAVPFGHASDSFAHSHYHTRIRRALGQDRQCLVEKGKRYWENGVLPAFDGHSNYPTPDFGNAQDALERSGWTSHEELHPLPNWWKDSFKKTKGKVPKSAVRKIYLDQSHDFQNDYGSQTATSAQYYGIYVPQNNAVLTLVAFSPRYKLDQRRVAEAEVSKQIPRMSQLSDLIWFTWTGVTDNPGSLRYYGVEGILNAVVKPLMQEIFQARRGTNDVPWDKRITFDLSSDEGKALFASPIGIAVNWLLIHHAAELGRREPRVTIWNPKNTNNLGDNFCMIWDLIPQEAKGLFGKMKGSFGKVEKEPKIKAGSSSGPQTRRAV
ncbi:MAG: hypothetical protein LQ348_000141 [Seirophora lacunosa]|nr:MAG: hypothetical protein LQ348_000141 [Seirophora lacunosa]